MCGIGGVLYFDLRRPGEQALKRMSAAMEERGPDDEGCYFAEGIGLVHRRLSIIDVSEKGRCPMPNETETIRVVHNGEIYNFRELRDDLRNCGHHFRSDSDTEVLVHGFEEWGEKLAEHIEGMFAFAVWDSKRGTLLLARDRIGEKPLYFQLTNEALVFASTLNALRAYCGSNLEVDREALECYLSHAFIPASHTIWSGVRVFPPAHVGVCGSRGKFSLSKYWDFPSRGPRKISIAQAETVIEDALDRSVEGRLIADVPVGAFLSGGVDSSIITAFAARRVSSLQTFSIGFKEADHNELPYARCVSSHLGTEHHELILSEEDLFGVVPELVWQLGQPFGDSSIIPTHLLSRFARERVKVALSGDGGDESFAGYWRTQAGWYASLFRRVLPRSVRQNAIPRITKSLDRMGRGGLAGRIDALNHLSLAAPGLGYTNSLTWFDRLGELLGPAFANAPVHDCAACRTGCSPGFFEASELQRMLYDDFQVLLPDDYLTKVDVASMAASLEVRAPFLDHRLIEAAWVLPDEFKLHWGASKWMLKRIAARHVPPKAVLRRKMGFALPMEKWWRGRLAHILQALLVDSRAVKWGWIRPEPVQEALKRHLSGAESHAVRLWLVLWLELWARIVVENSICRTASLKDIA